MSGTRYRQRGPSYFPREKLGDQYIRSGSWPNYNWTFLTSPYYPSANNTILNRWEESWDQTNPGPPYRSGGPFFLKRRGATFIDESDKILQRGLYKYKGRFRPNIPNNPLLSVYDGYVSSAHQFGTEAWNKFRPVKPSASLGQDVGESRDLAKLFTPKLLSIRKILSKRSVKAYLELLSNDYLNYQFGWRPFLKSIGDALSTTRKLDRKIAWVRKNNGKWIKRKGTLRDTRVVTTGNASGATPALHSSYYPWGVRTGQTVTVETDRVWFEAKMKYYIHSLKTDKADNIITSKLLQKFYGFELTPALVWELIPFSWLTDWFINIGDFMSNISNAAYDNLVAKYAYVMRHRQTETFYNWHQPLQCDDGHGSYSVQNAQAHAVIWAECKERAVASPWGFGGGDDSFTPRQLSILAALGIQAAI